MMGETETMLKIFLAEDEIVMREGIRNNIAWQEEGFEFVGEASDGELAYPMIQKLKPDILITDIRMPFMDGLELSRIVKQELPDTSILILSGYGEFDYAKEAISIGVEDYLLKPVTSAQLLEAIRRIAEKIYGRRGRQEETKNEKEQKTLTKRRLFRHIVSGEHSFSEVLKEAREQEIELAAERYNVLLLQLFFEDGTETFYEKDEAFEEHMEQFFAYGSSVICAKLSCGEYHLVLKEENGVTLEQLKDAIEQELEIYLCGENKIDYAAVYGIPVTRFSEIKKCYEEANLLFAKRYSLEKNKITEQVKKIENEMETKETLDLGELNVSGIDRRQVEQFLYTGRKEEVSGFVDDYFRKISNGSLQSVLLRQYVLMDLYVSAVSVLEKSGYTSENLLEQYKDAQKMEIFLGTAGQAREYIKNLFGAVIELREQGMERRYDNLIQHAKAYIEDNYNHEDISLNMVASEVNLSSSHFSTVFGQETGVTFVEYLTKVRMDKAKQLLRTTGTKTTEIAFEVGFRDAHYFSNLFKKTQGCTPREYRNRSDRPEQEREKL